MMPSSKSLLRDFSLVRFYSILILSLFYFATQLIVAHVCHSLILQIDAYHMLYNIFSLATCITTVQMCREGSNLKNTFGWTRIDVCGAVGNLCFLAALCFSVFVEALQTMFHVSHHEKMHYPLLVGVVGVAGLVVNTICFIVIGGYTFHQSSFIGSNHDGDDIIISASVQSYVKEGIKSRKRQGLLETFRDTFGAVLVIVCSAVVHFRQEPSADFFDPAVTILTVCILLLLSYSYAKEAGHILLLTIPDHINVNILVEELQKNFPEICDIHEFHVWQLTPARIIASAHVVLQHTQGYLATQNNIIDFLHTKGISQVTLQPEFLQLLSSEKSSCNRENKCFLPCDAEDCQEKQCCFTPSSDSKYSHSHNSHQHTHLNDSDTNCVSTGADDGNASDDEVLEQELKPMLL